MIKLQDEQFERSDSNYKRRVSEGFGELRLKVNYCLTVAVYNDGEERKRKPERFLLFEKLTRPFCYD